jgi:hypothetical protein
MLKIRLDKSAVLLLRTIVLVLASPWDVIGYDLAAENLDYIFAS